LQTVLPQRNISLVIIDSIQTSAVMRCHHPGTISQIPAGTQLLTAIAKQPNGYYFVGHVTKDGL